MTHQLFLFFEVEECYGVLQSPLRMRDCPAAGKVGRMGKGTGGLEGFDHALRTPMDGLTLGGNAALLERG